MSLHGNEEAMERDIRGGRREQIRKERELEFHSTKVVGHSRSPASRLDSDFFVTVLTYRPSGDI